MIDMSGVLVELGGEVKAYFAHPMRTYNTSAETEVIEVLRQKGWEVVNPCDYCDEAMKLTAQAGGGWLSCDVCRKKVMEPLFYRLLKGCDVFVRWNPLGTCGVECEMVEARKLGKDIYEVNVDAGNVCLKPLVSSCAVF